MATLKHLRQEAGMTAEDLAYLARVSLATISRVERGMPVRRLTVGKIVHALNERTGQNISINDLDGVQLLEERKPEESAA
jgi:predicted transcriptional regulator